MSAITIENELVHYEVLGRGRPVIFVHGWLGSWRYWQPTMQQLSAKYRTYALDLWGYGDSGKATDRYSLEEQVRLLSNFMEKLGIEKAALVGHSLGAAVCLRFANAHPKRAPRVVLISTPLNANANDALSVAPTSAETIAKAPAALPAYTPHDAATLMHNPLRRPDADEILEKLAQQRATKPAQTGPTLPSGLVKTYVNKPGDTSSSTAVGASTTTGSFATPTKTNTGAMGKIDTNNPLAKLNREKPLDLLNRYVPRNTPDFDRLRAEVAKADENALKTSTFSVSNINLMAELIQLQTPTLVLHGAKDPLLTPPPPDVLEKLASVKTAGHLLPFVAEDFQHFPMLEINAKFNRLLIDFFDATDLTKIQFKDQWIRTVR